MFGNITKTIVIKSQPKTQPCMKLYIINNVKIQLTSEQCRGWSTEPQAVKNPGITFTVGRLHGGFNQLWIKHSIFHLKLGNCGWECENSVLDPQLTG